MSNFVLNEIIFLLNGVKVRLKGDSEDFRQDIENKASRKKTTNFLAGRKISILSRILTARLRIYVFGSDVP